MKRPHAVLAGASTGIKFSGSGHQIVNNMVRGKHIHYAIPCDVHDLNANKGGPFEFG